MDLIRRRQEIVSRPITVKETRTILQGIKRETLEDQRDYALLLTALATGKRIREVLDLRIKHLVELPVILHQQAGEYFEAVIELGMTRSEDLVFPNLVWITCNLPIPTIMALSPRVFVVTLKSRAAKAGIDPERIGLGTWRRMAATIHSQEGGFAAFVESLMRM